MRAWVSQVFERPTITDMNTSDARRRNSDAAVKTESGHARALKRLQLSRARLNDQVEDPLASVVATANTAKRNRKRKNYVENEVGRNDDTSVEDRAFTGRMKYQTRLPGARKNMLDKKKSATRLNFTPEKESDSESKEDSTDAILPDIKERPNVLVYPTKKQKSQQKKYEGRKVWTDAEKTAVIEGMKYVGIGKWAEIKKEYAEILKFRTSGQIKDCYRTMKKRGELGDLEQAPSLGMVQTEKDRENQTEAKEEVDKNSALQEECP